jgi:hypothetical protein
MGEGYSLRRLDALEAKEQQLTYVQQNFPRLVPTVQRNLLFACINATQMSLKYLSPKDKAQAIQRTRLVFRGHSANLSPSIRSKERLWFFLAKCSLRGTAALRNFLKIGL